MELPAFLWYLEQWEIPEELKCERFGIRYFHHPELLEALSELAPETKLLALIDMAFKEGSLNSSGFVGSAEVLESLLVNSPLLQHESRKLLYSPASTGTLLGRLANKNRDRIEYKKTATHRLWTIKPPRVEVAAAG
jgi:hypothetical protein